MESTQFWTETTIHSQSTAALVLRRVSCGLWSSHMLWKTTVCLCPSHCTCTTCQSTKMRLNGEAIACQCPVWGTSRIRPLIGEPLATIRLLGWIIKIISALRWLKWICLLCPMKSFGVDGMNLSRSGELNARTVQLSQLTVKCLSFILTVGLPIPSPVTSMAKMERFTQRITSDITKTQILLSVVAHRQNPQLSTGLEVDKLAKMVTSLTGLYYLN